MATRYTKDGLAGKVDWEGGVAEAITGYGISSDALPEDTPRKVVESWKNIEGMSEDISRINEWLFGGE